MQSYLNFRRLADRPPFPVHQDVVRLWSFLFRPGRTFAQYLIHLMKACILIHQPTDWMSPDIRSVARGLANAQDLPFRLQNYLFAGELSRLIWFTKLSTELGQASFLSFLCLLRAPSETLFIRMAKDSDLLTDFSPHDFKVLAGARLVGNSELLALKSPGARTSSGGVFYADLAGATKSRR